MFALIKLPFKLLSLPLMVAFAGFFDMDRNSEKDARTQSEVDQKNQPAK